MIKLSNSNRNSKIYRNSKSNKELIIKIIVIIVMKMNTKNNRDSNNNNNSIRRLSFLVLWS